MCERLPAFVLAPPLDRAAGRPVRFLAQRRARCAALPRLGGGTFFFVAYNSYPVAYNFLGYYGWVMLAGYMKYPWLQYLAWQLAVPVSLFCANSIMVFVFKLRLRRWEYLVLPFFPVPIYALSYVLLMLLAKTDIVPHSDWESDSIYQFKTGTIIFGYMVVEGVFILLHQRRAAHNEACGCIP